MKVYNNLYTLKDSKDLQETIEELQSSWQELDSYLDIDEEGYYETSEKIAELIENLEPAREAAIQELETYYDENTIRMDSVHEMVNDTVEQEISRIIKKDFEKPVDELVGYFARLKELEPDSQEHFDAMHEISLIIDDLESEVEWV